MSEPKEQVPTAWEDGGLCYSSGLALDTAKKMLDAAQSEAKNQKACMSFSITDAGGNLVAFRRMDYAPLFGIQISMNKAFTAVFGKMPSQYWQPVFSAGILPTLPFHDHWSAFAGGFPLKQQGKLFGGFGVSGGVAHSDLSVAKAALLAGGFSPEDVDAAIAAMSAG